MTGVLVFGVAVMDFVLFVDAFPDAAEKYRAEDAVAVGGGCGANAAVAISRLGGHAHLSARLGSDAVGDLIAAELQAEGLDTSGLNRAACGRSSFSSILVDSKGERQIVNFRGSSLAKSADWLTLPVDTGAVLTDTRWPAGTRRSLQLAQTASIPGIVDAEAPLDPDDIAAASHVTFSAQGLRSLYPDLPLREALQRYQLTHGGWACVTDGADGVRFTGPAGTGHLPAYPVDTVDTLGAGDVWHGAFALRLAEGATEAQAVRFANAAAAIKCTRRGGRAGTPARSEVETFLREREDATNGR
ncbi:PfkB family carbohydrate kinase [Pseudoruegeria sp. HB172150]|uniref:PfkB family carbohydrate kinase n=1 Tax=Pseudoruegeria sp. HB172150 TaxID=2721164 RepID=UPI00155628E7|nr:PfkB family carbohydrate kinase [Pseudoruegeria sp. HB172150]